ncbi:L-threonylcarbamoyladenylate synthase [Acetoanaerobium noterae]|uniref:Threonylcarbamoyl-AMP synthase n=1 Tax=Acetoanaerobium noterae TaxID=745369 RepID=A0A1T5A9A4_9FIRM|nr:L-threonylcarbamoyladenylate synthase [Acetoanaerobium noterae]SKB31562.1 L-threonylcarbamoyladenylate synthase [Acetoanaerobium noterae]
MKAKRCLLIDTDKDKEFLDEKLHKVANLLKAGKTVVFPTETVYGLGANALDPEAAKKIYEAKGRPSDNPLIVHISKKEDVDFLAGNISQDAKLLMEAFWPGPLTLILDKSDNVPIETTGGLMTVAIRMPSNPIARKLIDLAGVPIAAPSANISGRPSITSSKYLVEELCERVDAIIISEDSEIGLESTVIDMTASTPVILRPGKIGKTEIEKILNKEIELDPSLKDENAAPKSPGMKYKHYSPNATVIVVTGSLDEMKQKINQKLSLDKNKSDKVKVVCLEDRVSLYDGYGISWGKNSQEAARNLFKILRLMDEQNIEVVYFEELNSDEISEAVMNRLIKAAGNMIL